MDPVPELREAPPGAERYFRAPRNPRIPSPDRDEIIGGVRWARYARVGAVYAGVALPPEDRRRFIAWGSLLFSRLGIVFLPEANVSLGASQHRGLEQPWEAPLKHIWQGWHTSPLEHFLRAVIGGSDDSEDPSRRLEALLNARLHHPNFHLIPYVDVVEAGYRGQRLGIFRGMEHYLSITTEDAVGQRTAYTFSAGRESLPAEIFLTRLLREIAQERTDLLSSNWTAGDLASELESSEEALRVPWQFELPGPVLSALTTSEEAKLVLQRLEPMLPAYRRVPVMAYVLQIVDLAASAEPVPSDWAPDWRVVDFHFNFLPGDEPPP